MNKAFRPKLHQSLYPSLRKLIEDCWKNDPAERPAFDEISLRMGGVIRDEIATMDEPDFDIIHPEDPNATVEEVPTMPKRDMLKNALGFNNNSPNNSVRNSIASPTPAMRKSLGIDRESFETESPARKRDIIKKAFGFDIHKSQRKEQQEREIMLQRQVTMLKELVEKIDSNENFDRSSIKKSMSSISLLQLPPMAVDDDYDDYDDHDALPEVTNRITQSSTKVASAASVIDTNGVASKDGKGTIATNTGGKGGGTIATAFDESFGHPEVKKPTGTVAVDGVKVAKAMSSEAKNIENLMAKSKLEKKKNKDTNDKLTSFTDSLRAKPVDKKSEAKKVEPQMAFTDSLMAKSTGNKSSNENLTSFTDSLRAKPVDKKSEAKKVEPTKSEAKNIATARKYEVKEVGVSPELSASSTQLEEWSNSQTLGR